MAEYFVLRTADTTYLDRQNIAVSGQLVTVEFPEFDEVHDFKLPNNDPATVDKAVQKWLSNRRKLAELGG